MNCKLCGNLGTYPRLTTLDVKYNGPALDPALPRKQESSGPEMELCESSFLVDPGGKTCMLHPIFLKTMENSGILMDVSDGRFVQHAKAFKNLYETWKIVKTFTQTKWTNRQYNGLRSQKISALITSDSENISADQYLFSFDSTLYVTWKSLNSAEKYVF